MIRPKLQNTCMALVAGLAASSTALADTTDVTWQNRVEVTKEGAHCADDANCFNRYHPAIPAAASAAPGDHLIFSYPGCARCGSDARFRR